MSILNINIKVLSIPYVETLSIPHMEKGFCLNNIQNNFLLVVQKKYLSILGIDKIILSILHINKCFYIPYRKCFIPNMKKKVFVHIQHITNLSTCAMDKNNWSILDIDKIILVYILYVQFFYILYGQHFSILCIRNFSIC